MNLFNLVLALPLLGFVLILFVPKESKELIRKIALGVSLLTFALAVGLLPDVMASPARMSHVTDVQWIRYPNIHYHVGLDGVSLWLVVLVPLMTALSMLISKNTITRHEKHFYAFMLVLQFGLTGVFAALDLFLFYVFWEAALVPMYFLVGIWGGTRRVYAALKLFVYTMSGSVLMLGGIVYLYDKTGTFDSMGLVQLVSSGRLTFSSTEGTLLFLAFFAAFAIKVPIFPLHTWLPDAYLEAPTAGTVMLAALMSKMGTYGLLRFCLPLFPNAARENAGWVAGLAIIGIVYGALVALVQPNMKKLVAYSSVSHLGFVVLGIFSFTSYGLDGAAFMMVAHAISTGALFMLVGMLQERRGTLEIRDFGGAATPAPWFATVFLVALFASIGLPTLSNFVGEFLVLQGAAAAHFSWAAFAGLGVILSACYMLWMYQRVFLGRASDVRMPDLNTREWAALIPMVALMIVLGVGSQFFLSSITASNADALMRTKGNQEQNVRLGAQKELARAH